MRIVLGATAVAVALAVAAPALAAGPTAKVLVEPTTIGIGEPFTIRVEASPADARIEVDPRPFEPLGPPQIARDGDVAVATQRFVCLALECAPGARGRTVLLPPVRVGGVAVGPERALRVVPRVPAAAAKRSEPSFRSTTSPPSPSWRIDPGTGARLLVLLAVALGLAALLLVGYELRRGRAPAAPSADALARAVRLVRESVLRPPEDRRRAAGLLARILAERGTRRLADSAAAVAWSPPQPPPAAAETLAEAVERELAS